MGAFGASEQSGVRVEALRHLVADDVDKTLEDCLDVDILLGGGLEEFEPQLVSQLLSPLGANDSFVLHIAFVAHQDYLGVVPRVRLDLGHPVLDAVEGFLVGDVVH